MRYGDKRQTRQAHPAPPNRWLIVLEEKGVPNAIHAHTAQTLVQVSETLNQFLWHGPSHSSGAAFNLQDGSMWGNTWEEYVVEGYEGIYPLGWKIDETNGISFHRAEIFAEPPVTSEPVYSTNVVPSHYAVFPDTFPKYLLFLPIEGTHLRFDSFASDEKLEIEQIVAEQNRQFALVADIAAGLLFGKLPGDLAIRQLGWC